VISRIDYCNCLLAVAPQYQLNQLQAAMNSAGRLICGLNKFDRISRVLRDRLHWLPIPQWIRYKLCLQGSMWSCTTVSSRLLPANLCHLSVPEADCDRPHAAATSSSSQLRRILDNVVLPCLHHWHGTGMPPEISNNFNSRLICSTALTSTIISFILG